MSISYDPRAAVELAAGGLGVEWDAQLVTSALDDPVDVTVLEVLLEEDETRWPRCQLTIDIDVPDEATRLAISPTRNTVRVQLDATYTYADGTRETQQRADLMLRSVTYTRGKGYTTYRLVAQSDEVAVSDLAYEFYRGDVGGTTLTRTGPVATVIEDALDEFTDGAVRGFVSTVPASKQLPAEHRSGTLTTYQVTDPVALLRSWADAVSAVLYCDAWGIWHLDPFPGSLSTSRAILGSQQIVEITETDSRETWASDVYLTYGNKNANDAEYFSHVGLVYSDGLLRRRYHESRPVSVDVSGADSHGQVNDSATFPLARRLARRNASYDVAITPHVWLASGDTVTITPPGGDESRRIITAVTLRGKGPMTLRTRIP